MIATFLIPGPSRDGSTTSAPHVIAITEITSRVSFGTSMVGCWAIFSNDLGCLEARKRKVQLDL